MKVFAKAFLCGAGLRPEDLKARLAAANPDMMVQAVNGDAAKNLWFIELLAAQTLQAESSGSLLAKKPEIDFLLRLAGTTQISRAIKRHGARAGEPFLLVVAGRVPPRGTGELKGKELPRNTPTARELAMVEKAALLSADRA